MSKKSKIICDYCQSPFVVMPSRRTGVKRFCSHKCSSLYRRGGKLSDETKRKIRQANLGEKSSQWKGGRVIREDGYIRVYCPDHPYTVGGYVLEHRLIMEAHMGRYLLPTEIVHHVDGNPANNVIENLALFSEKGAHTGYHNKLRGR